MYAYVCVCVFVSVVGCMYVCGYRFMFKKCDRILQLAYHLHIPVLEEQASNSGNHVYSIYIMESLYTQTHPCIHIYMHIYIYIYIYIYIHVYVCVCACICVYITYKCHMLLQTHTRTHTRICY